MSEKSPDEKPEYSVTAEANIENLFTDTDNDVGVSRKDNESFSQFTPVHHSDSDTVVNKSDSDDGLFVTDSSDDVLHDELSDFFPANERLEQTRETIMESLAQSFVSVTPHDHDAIAEEQNEIKNERQYSNDTDHCDQEDTVSVQRDLRALQCIIPMRRIPSDSAFPDFQRNTTDDFPASNAGSEDYVTVGSASEEPTTASFFSQPPSTSQLHVVTKARYHVRSKSASSFRTCQPKPPDPKRPMSAQAASDVEHWVVNDNWMKVSDAEERQTATTADSEIGNLGVGLTATTKKACASESKPHPKPRRQAGTGTRGSPSFKATKLPVFYYRESKHKTASSRSEGCVLPAKEKVSTTKSGSVSARRSQSSAARASLMVRSTASERSDKKDAGGVSYAFKHLSQANRTPGSLMAKKPRAAGKVRPPLGSRSPVRAYPSPSSSPMRSTMLEMNSKSACSSSEPPDNASGACIANGEEKVLPHDMPEHATRTTKVGSTCLSDDKMEAEDLQSSDNTHWTSSATGHSKVSGLKMPQKVRPGSPMKVLKLRSTPSSKDFENASAVNDDEPSCGNVNDCMKHKVSTSSSILIKRPSLPQPNSFVPALSTSTTHEKHASSAGCAESNGTNGNDVSPGDQAEGQPAVMSLKVDVSVRAEDGSVHNFRDVSPVKSSKSTDLFSGVEEFIRNLLEGSGAIPTGSPGQALTTTPVNAVSPRSGLHMGASPRAPKPEDSAPLATVEIQSGSMSVESYKQNYGPSDSKDHPCLTGPDAFAHRLQTEDSLLLTSTGSMTSSDACPVAARRQLMTSTASRRVNTYSKPKYNTAQHSTNTATGKGFGALKQERGVVYRSIERERERSKSPVSGTMSKLFRIDQTEKPPRKLGCSPSPERRKRLSSSISPQRLKSLSPSPERSDSVSPRSRIPILRRRLSSESTGFNRYQSRSPTPERDSFYHTAQTTPERPRSATPNSLCSASGSSRHSLGRSACAWEPRTLRAHGSVRVSSPTGIKLSNAGRSRSASPQSARSTPSEKGISACSYECSGEDVQVMRQGSPTTPAGKYAMDSEGYHPEGYPVKRRVGGCQSFGNFPRTSSSSATHSSTTDNEPNTSSSVIEFQQRSSAGWFPVQADTEGTRPCHAPTPAKRTFSGAFRSSQDAATQPPVPRKRQDITSHEISTTPQLQNEDGTIISGRTSFCSVESPRRDRSLSPKRPAPRTPSQEGNVHALGAKWIGDSKDGNAKIGCNPELKNQDVKSGEQAQEFCKDADVTPTELERELIETENTVRLMEETICVLERQNHSLATNTREMSAKLDQEKSRRCDLKTAKLMLQRVRKELARTTKNSEEKRLELTSAKDRIAEQDSVIYLLRETLREECCKNGTIPEHLKREHGVRRDLTCGPDLSPLSVQGRCDRPLCSPSTEPGSVRDLLADTEIALREERRAREEAEQKLADEISRKQRIVEAAKKWRDQLSCSGETVRAKESKCTETDLKITAACISESDSSNMKSYQSLHAPSTDSVSAADALLNSKSNESVVNTQKFHMESVSGSEYFGTSNSHKRDRSCQCDMVIESADWQQKYEEERQRYDACASKLSAISLDRTDLKSQLEIVNGKLKETAQKKSLLEQELKGLIDKIHEMQRDVQLYQRQSAEQLTMLTHGEHDHIETIEIEKIKLKEYYQQQVETIVQEKVTEFQCKVTQLEKIVRDQINTYTKSMQQKFREKLATASLQQKEIVSRLQVEHSKELERLTEQYPQEIDRLQQCLADCQEEIVDKKCRLEQRETQVGTILRVVKLLIREGRAMRGDQPEAEEQNTVEIARKILKCMDLDLDDIVSPRPCQKDGTDALKDRESFTKDGSCVTFRSIPDSPRPLAAHRTSLVNNAPPVPPRRKTVPHINTGHVTLTQKKSDHSTTSQAFDLCASTGNTLERTEDSSANKMQRKISYTRFGDEVLRAKSEECLQKPPSTPARHFPTLSDLTLWGESGSWNLDGAPPTAPPPTPPSVTTSTGTNTDEGELPAKESGQELAASVMMEMNQPARVKTFTDKATGSASSLSADPALMLLVNAFLAEEANKACQCKHLRRAMEAYRRLGSTGGGQNNSVEDSCRRAMTRSSSETSIQRLASNFLEARCHKYKVLQAKQCGFRKDANVGEQTNFEQAGGNKQIAVTATSRTSSESNQLFGKEVRKTLAAKAIETGGKFANPFSMRPLPANRVSLTSEKITSKPPIQRAQSPSPSRSATAQSPSPVRPGRSSECAMGIGLSSADVSRSRSRQDTGFVERTISPSKNVLSKDRKFLPNVKRMPSFDKIDNKESSDDSKFALKNCLVSKPRDSRLSAQRKQIAAAARKPASREKHSLSPRERKLFTLRNQQQPEKKVTRTQVTKRTLSPSPVSPQAELPADLDARKSREFVPTFKPQHDKRRRSATSSMDWRKYIKQGQPWQEVYLRDYNDTGYDRTMSTSNEVFYTPEDPNDESDGSQWSPSYSWAPPRRSSREKYNRYLSTGHAADELALERFYATPERESTEARRRMRRSKKQAEVLEHINRLLNVSSASDVAREERRRPGRISRRSRSFQRPTRDVSWEQPPSTEPVQDNVLDSVRRKAFGHAGAIPRHPMDPLADLPIYPPSSEHNLKHHHHHHRNRVSLSLDRDLPMPKRDCSVHRKLSADVKTHMRLAKDHKKHRKASDVLSRERSPSQQRWTGDGQRKGPLVLVSRSPRRESGPPEHYRPRSWSRSRHGGSAHEPDMESWADAWEQRWEHERKQKPLTHWPAT